MSTAPFHRYGLNWPADTDPLDVELYCIRKGENWCVKNGKSLFYHYKQCEVLLWPEDHHHRWSDLTLKEILGNQITVLMGASDTGKTYSMVRFALVDFFAFPYNTLTIVSSTDSRGLELRIWGKIKELFNRSKDLRPDLPGFVIDSQKAITPDEVDDTGERARTLTKGIICVPCVQGSNYVGLGKYIGIKPPNSPGKQDGRLRHLGDEVQAMKGTFLDAYANWMGKPDFKGVMSGNPTDPLDPLGKAAEPLDGWDNQKEPDKTATWESRFYGARVVNLVGTDSPNFDAPKDQPLKYPELISWKKIEAVAKTWGKDSLQYYSQCVGVMKPGFAGKRVITREICRLNKASDVAIWEGSDRTRIYAIDPAYGGGDRCVAGMVEFGEDINGTTVIMVDKPKVVPISLRLNVTPEEQIAEFVYHDARQMSVSDENIFYDSFGKGTVGFAFAKRFGSNPPIPVESGGSPTDRPVRHDLSTRDEKSGQLRLKTCNEHYRKRITELWFSVRYVIECGQMRGMTDDVIDEGCMREYRVVGGDAKIEVETKDELKDRMGKSPDLFDWLAIAVEGCRQRGFRIQRLGETVENKANSIMSWYVNEQKQNASRRLRSELKYT
ncbi:MAG: hypothetical protein WCI55_08105 [Armatimonadota bacterium]